MVKEKYFENQTEKVTHNSFGNHLNIIKPTGEISVGFILINLLLKY